MWHARVRRKSACATSIASNGSTMGPSIRIDARALVTPVASPRLLLRSLYGLAVAAIQAYVPERGLFTVSTAGAVEVQRPTVNGEVGSEHTVQGSSHMIQRHLRAVERPRI